MRIVILVRILWTAGAPKKAIRQATELIKMGHDVHLVFLRKAGRLAGYEDLLKGLNHSIMVERNTSLLVPLYDFITGLFAPDRKGEGRLDYNLIRRFPKYIYKSLPDILICHDQYAGLAGYYLKRKYSIPYIVLLHERINWKRKGMLSKLAQHYEKITLLNAKYVIASTDKIALTAKRKYGIPCMVNYQGLDILEFSQFKDKENALIAVSMWDEGRRPVTYLDIIATLPNYKLYMIGNWRTRDLEQMFTKEIQNRKICNQVVLKKGITEKELNELYDRSKFVIRFGFGEYGESHAVFEGLQRGLPVIINEDLGSSQFVKAYRVGCVLDEIVPKKVEEFINQFDNADQYKEIQDRIISLSVDLNWKNHAQKLLNLRTTELQQTPEVTN